MQEPNPSAVADPGDMVDVKTDKQSFSFPGVVVRMMSHDRRGVFSEIYNLKRFDNGGFPRFVQDNISVSDPEVLRGIHYQKDQGKLLRVLHGSIFDVIVNLKKDSDAFGWWQSTVLKSLDHWLWIPPGYGHGFCVIGDEKAVVLYKTTTYYEPDLEGGIRWDDPLVQITWPLSSPILSKRDSSLPSLRDFVDSGVIL